jgi:Lrp/AsnC family transcriptional regulator for asnA, asnC and gidA
MDKKDSIILSSLMKNARIPKTRIARTLGISETAVRKRIANLERIGVILGYRAIINFKKANLFASITGIDVEPESIWKVIEKLKDAENVKTVFLTSGDHTIMAEILAQSLEELSEIHSKLMEMDGVKRVCPAVILDVVK